MVKNNVKPTSIRPRHGLLEKIDSICEKLDCSRNDYINTVLESAVSEDMGEENTPRPDRNPTPKPRITKISYDNGKTWDDVPGKKPQVIFVDGDPRDYEIIKS